MEKTADIVQYLNDVTENVLEDLCEGVYIEPPVAGYSSAEDEGPEDGGGRLKDLHAKQLLGPCEILEQHSIRETQEYESDDSDVSFGTDDNFVLIAPPTNSYDELSHLNNATLELLKNKDQSDVDSNASSIETSSSVPNQKNQLVIDSSISSIGTSSSMPDASHDRYEWLEKSSLGCLPMFPASDYTDICNMLPHEVFELFFDKSMLDMLSDQSNKYAAVIDKEHPNITEKEILAFIGILIMSGHVRCSNTSKFWGPETDTFSNPMAMKAMSLQRFRQLCRYMHFQSSDAYDENDRMWKLRPYTDRLNQNFAEHFHPEQHLSYDECMIAYYGKHTGREYIRKDPVRFGYKARCLNTPSGYCLSFDINQGMDSRHSAVIEAKYGKDATPLLYMIDALPEAKQNLPYSFYLKKSCTSVPLLHYLKSKGYDGTGIIRENSIPPSCTLPENRMLKLNTLGTIESMEIANLNIKVQ